MRPGLLPRRYFSYELTTDRLYEGFNEAGAFAPEIFAEARPVAQGVALASMRPGLLPRRYPLQPSRLRGALHALQ